MAIQGKVHCCHFPTFISAVMENNSATETRDDGTVSHGPRLKHPSSPGFSDSMY
jgi:hypothetical protein